MKGTQKDQSGGDVADITSKKKKRRGKKSKRSNGGDDRYPGNFDQLKNSSALIGDKDNICEKLIMPRSDNIGDVTSQTARNGACEQVVECGNVELFDESKMARDKVHINNQNVSSPSNFENDKQITKNPRTKLTLSDSFKILKNNGKRFLSFRGTKPKTETTDATNNESVINVDSKETNGNDKTDEESPDHQHLPEAEHFEAQGSMLTLLDNKSFIDISVTEELTTDHILQQEDAHHYCDNNNVSDRIETPIDGEIIPSSKSNINETSTEAEVPESSFTTEASEIKDQSKVIDVEFNSFYSPLVPDNSRVLSDPQISLSDNQNDIQISSVINTCQHIHSVPIRNRIIETHFDSLQAETVYETDTCEDGVVEFDSLLADDSALNLKMKCHDSVVSNVDTCDENTTEHSLSSECVDFNNAEITYCSTLKDLSPNSNNSMSTNDSLGHEVEQKRIAAPFASCINEDHKHCTYSSIKASPERVKVTNMYNQKAMIINGINDTLHNISDSKEDKSVIASNIDRYFPSTNTTRRTISVKGFPKPLAPERFACFGSPIDRYKTSLEDNGNICKLQDDAHIGHDVCGIRSFPPGSSELKPNKRIGSNTVSKRSKKRQDAIHARSLRVMPTILEDTGMIGTHPGSYEHLLKILVIGNLSTGKTSIIRRYVNHFYTEYYRATVGVDFALKRLQWDEDIIRLQLWDIAGQERYAGGMTRVYYKEAVGAFVVFDSTDLHSFEAALRWKKDLDDKVTLPNGAPIPSVLLANKCDRSEKSKLKIIGSMEEVCRKAGFNMWFPTSAKENINIDEAVNFLINSIMTLQEGCVVPNGSYDSDIISVNDDAVNSSTKRSCQC